MKDRERPKLVEKRRKRGRDRERERQRERQRERETETERERWEDLARVTTKGQTNQNRKVAQHHELEVISVERPANPYSYLQAIHTSKLIHNKK